MRKLLGILALSISATAIAYANPSNPPPSQTPDVWTQPQDGWTQSDLQAIDNWLDKCGDQFEDWFYSTWGKILGITDPDSDSGHGTVAAPELDPAEALAALTLLSGGLAVLRGRRSSKKNS